MTDPSTFRVVYVGECWASSPGDVGTSTMLTPRPTEVDSSV